MATDWLEVKNNAASTLTGAVDGSTDPVTIPVADGSLFPAAFPFDITIDSEILRVTAKASNDLTATRAQQGTSIAAHSSGATVELRVTAGIVSQVQTSLGTLEDGAALLAGRSGGQTLIGGTGSGNGLTLKDTSHATRGSLVLDGITGVQLNSTTLTSAYTAITVASGQTITLGALGGVRALVFSGTYNIGSSDPAGTSFLVFNANPVINLTHASADINEMKLFSVAPTVSVDAAIAAGNVGGSVFAYDVQPLFTQGSGGTATLPGLTGLRVAPTFESGWITTGGGIVKGLDFAPNATASNIKNFIAVDVTDLNAATLNLSLRSVGTGVQMHHAGPARFGATGAPTASTALDVQGRLDVTGDLRHQGSNVGFFNVTPVARQSVGAAATDPATTQTLANNLRTALINLGLAQT